MSLLGWGLVFGCSLDSRTLRVMSGASDAGNGGTLTNSDAGVNDGSGRGGGTPNAGGGAAGSSAGDSGDGGESGDSGRPTVNGCADLDGNGISDCAETIVTNPTFKIDVAGWAPEPDTTVNWDRENAWGDIPSGSARVESLGVIDANAGGAALRAASQCVPVPGKKLLSVYANVLVDAGQDPQGRAEIDVFFFDAADCQGASSASFWTPQPLGASVGSWLIIKAGSVSGEATKSALIKLALSRPFRADSFRARFDNILVRLGTP